jgi:hypothetical protein
LSTTGTALELLEPAEDNPAPGSPGRGAFELPPFVQQLLGYAGFAYVVGFVTLVANTARYGIPIQEFAKPLTIWAGAIPTVTVFLAIVVNRKLKEGHPEYRASLGQVASDLFILAVCIAVGLAYPWYAGWAVRAQSHLFYAKWLPGYAWSAAWQARHPVITDLFGELCLFSYLAWKYATYRKMTLQDVEKNLKAYFARYALSALMALALALYIWVGYPEWPQQYGFGRPQSVRLLVSASDSPLPLADSQSGGLRLTAPVELLFRTDSEYVVQYWVDGKAKIVSVDASSIKGTMWN